MDTVSEVELLGYMVVLFLIFWETFKLFTIVETPIYNPTNSAQRFPEKKALYVELIRKGGMLAQVRRYSSVQFSHSVVSNFLQLHEPQHARSPCPSPTPGIHPNPCRLSQWCHPIISFSVIPFSCPQSFPTSGSFPMSQLFASAGKSIRVSASNFLILAQQSLLLSWTRGLCSVYLNSSFYL